MSKTLHLDLSFSITFFSNFYAKIDCLSFYRATAFAAYTHADFLHSVIPRSIAR